MHYLITGHTGFKGAWMIGLLTQMGHQVSGISLDPEQDSIFSKTHISKYLSYDKRVDIRQYSEFAHAVEEIQPDVIIHLAAQSQVLLSYDFPEITFETNVNGTLNLLSIASKTKSVLATLIITTDKVYKNNNTLQRYKEEDELKGSDPYSASKAMADLLTQSWFHSFPGSPVAIARAGNVIGGGDHSPDRLIPNVVNSLLSGSQPLLRNPDSVRPWQHVLDCLNGYVALTENMLETKKGGIWNFGPNVSDCHTVKEVAEVIISEINPNLTWGMNPVQNWSEEKLLLVDSQKARVQLNWKEKFSFKESILQTLNWYTTESQSKPTEYMISTIQEFISLP